MLLLSFAPAADVPWVALENWRSGLSGWHGFSGDGGRCYSSPKRVRAGGVGAWTILPFSAAMCDVLRRSQTVRMTARIGAAYARFRMRSSDLAGFHRRVRGQDARKQVFTSNGAP